MKKLVDFRMLSLHLGWLISNGVVLAVMNVSHANIPAAYLACEGAEEGADCALPGPQYGVCTRDTFCVDPPTTSVNECILCVDSCWSNDEGASCVRPWTGEAGICEDQQRCTDKVETSFLECRRCVAQSVEEVTEQSVSQGCSTQPILHKRRPDKTTDTIVNDLIAVFICVFLFYLSRFCLNTYAWQSKKS